MGAMKFEKLVSIERIKLAFRMLDIVLSIIIIRMEMVIYQRKN